MFDDKSESDSRHQPTNVTNRIPNFIVPTNQKNPSLTTHNQTAPQFEGGYQTLSSEDITTEPPVSEENDTEPLIPESLTQQILTESNSLSLIEVHNSPHSTLTTEDIPIYAESETLSSLTQVAQLQLT